MNRTPKPKIVEPPLSSFQYPIIHLVVGEDKVDFGIHKGLLLHYSSYFRGAFNGDFEEARTGVFVFEDEDDRLVPSRPRISVWTRSNVEVVVWLLLPSLHLGLSSQRAYAACCACSSGQL